MTAGGPTKKSDVFRRIANGASQAMGSPWAFLLALTLVIVWAASGPAFGFSETWQLVINTSTTIVTFLMVFLIQATQNRDAVSIQLKLDELVRATKARNVFADLEHADEEEIAAYQREFEELRRKVASGER